MTIRRTLLGGLLAVAATLGLVGSTAGPAAAVSCGEISSAFGSSVGVYRSLDVDFTTTAYTGVANCASGWPAGYRYSSYIFEGSTVYASAVHGGTDNRGNASFPTVRATLGNANTIGYGVKVEAYQLDGSLKVLQKRAWRIDIGYSFNTATNTHSTLYIPKSCPSYAYSSPCVPWPF